MKLGINIDLACTIQQANRTTKTQNKFNHALLKEKLARIISLEIIFVLTPQFAAINIESFKKILFPWNIAPARKMQNISTLQEQSVVPCNNPISNALEDTHVPQLCVQFYQQIGDIAEACRNTYLNQILFNMAQVAFHHGCHVTLFFTVGQNTYQHLENSTEKCMTLDIII